MTDGQENNTRNSELFRTEFLIQHKGQIALAKYLQNYMGLSNTFELTTLIEQAKLFVGVPQPYFNRDAIAEASARLNEKISSYRDIPQFGNRKRYLNRRYGSQDCGNDVLIVDEFASMKGMTEDIIQPFLHLPHNSKLCLFGLFIILKVSVAINAYLKADFQTAIASVLAAARGASSAQKINWASQKRTIRGDERKKVASKGAMAAYAKSGKAELREIVLEYLEERNSNFKSKAAFVRDVLDKHGDQIKSARTIERWIDDSGYEVAHWRKRKRN